MVVTAQNVTSDPSNWRVGGIPLLSLLRSQPKSGYKRSELVVPSEEVDLSGQVYQRVKALERSWKFVDHYSNPGPIQFQGFAQDDIALTLKYMLHSKT